MEADEDPENIILEVQLPKYLDSSLIDVDVHPKHVTIVAKNKTLRLRFPEDVNSDAGKAERSRVTGTLKLTLPKADKQSVERCRRIKEFREAKYKQQQEATENTKIKKIPTSRTKTFEKQTKISDEILAEASKAVKIKGLVKKDEPEETHQKKALRMEAIMTTQRFSNQEEQEPVGLNSVDDDVPPPIF